MASPRPVLKRQNSKVRFSRADMSPIGTMASDSTVHGVHGQHSQPRLQDPFTQPAGPQATVSYPQYGEHEEEQRYTIDSYPFSEDISLSTSEAPDPAHPSAYYREMGPDEEVHPHDSGSQRFESNDGYTATPPRVGSGRRWSTPQHRPTLDTLKSADTVDQMVSPRGSVLGAYDNPRSPYQGSPQARPASALRSSLVMPQHGSPQHGGQRDERLDYPGVPYRNSPVRSSAPNIGTPPRRMLDQHRASVPEYGSPVIGSPHFGSPRGSPNPAIRRYPEYETAPQDRLSPVPPYQSPRNSYTRSPGPAQPREWEDQAHHERYRQDSDTTLQGETDDRKASYEKPSNGKPTRRPRSNSSDSGKSVAEQKMHRRTTREMENDDSSSYQVRGGVFSQLLRLTGRSNTLRRRQSSRGVSSQGVAGGELPTMKTLGLKRSTSTASTIFGADELDPDDPRVTGQKKKKGRRNSWTDLPFTRTGSSDGTGDPKKKRRASIQFHVAGEWLDVHRD